mgnify:CR=1 FL=1
MSPERPQALESRWSRVIQEALNQKGYAYLVSLLSAYLNNAYNQIHYSKYSSVNLKCINKGMTMPIIKKDLRYRYCTEFCTHLGMTLIELMVVIIIIGVLATLIFPSFEQHILASRRGDGITQLLRLKIQQEAFRIENVSYANTEQLSLPTSKYHVFIVSDVSAKTYTITAKAIGSQLADETCLTMQINQSMHKTPANCFL